MAAFPVLYEIVVFVVTYRTQIAVELVSTFLIYLLIKYRFKVPSTRLDLRPEVVEKLIEEYQPDPIVTTSEDEEMKKVEAKQNLCSYDVFDLAKKDLDAIKGAIREYGVGTCGPRGFYGTLDIHLQLENKLSKLYRKDGAVVYSNYFIALQSICACFCIKKNTVYFQKTANEAILRGLCESHASTIAFDDLDDLETKLSEFIPDRYVVLERLSKNTGELLDISRVVRMRKEYGFRLILDEAGSFPFIYNTPDDLESYSDVDIIVGSLGHGLPAAGGFSCGNADAVEHQRLASNGYVFSASLPAFLVRAVLCFMSRELDYVGLREKIKAAHTHIPGVVSDIRSPVILVSCEDPSLLRMKLREAGYPAGISGSYLRLCVGVNVAEDTLKEVGNIIKGA